MTPRSLTFCGGRAARLRLGDDPPRLGHLRRHFLQGRRAGREPLIPWLDRPIAPLKDEIRAQAVKDAGDALCQSGIAAGHRAVQAAERLLGRGIF